MITLGQLIEPEKHPAPMNGQVKSTPFLEFCGDGYYSYLDGTVWILLTGILKLVTEQCLLGGKRPLIVVGDCSPMGGTQDFRSPSTHPQHDTSWGDRFDLNYVTNGGNNYTHYRPLGQEQFYLHQDGEFYLNLVHLKVVELIVRYWLRAGEDNRVCIADPVKKALRPNLGAMFDRVQGDFNNAQHHWDHMHFQKGNKSIDFDKVLWN